jgi:hypothetical protein
VEEKVFEQLNKLAREAVGGFEPSNRAIQLVFIEAAYVVRGVTRLAAYKCAQNRSLEELLQVAYGLLKEIPETEALGMIIVAEITAAKL